MTTTITEKNTKAEIIAAFEAAAAEHAKFRQEAVDKTMAATKRHGWCSEAKKILIDLGLSDLLPPSIKLQRKTSADSPWSDWADGYTTETRAHIDAASARRGDIASAREDHKYASRRSSRTLYLEVSKDSDFEELAKKVQEGIDREKALSGPFVEPEYPQYRVVSVKGGEITVLEPPAPAPVKPRAKKAPATATATPARRARRS